MTTPETTRFKQTIRILILLLPILAILWRLECRSIFYPGWDLLGSANGMFILSTSSFIDAVKEFFWLSRHFQYWNQTNSVIFSLIPGGLSKLFPSEFWAHFTTFVVFGISLALIAKVVGLKKSELYFMALLVASTPALLSFSIAGYPYISGFLPHGLVLLLVLRKNQSLHPALLVIAGFAIIELSWHVYELGKTIFIIFFFAALLLPGQQVRNRILYALLGIVSVSLIWANRQANVDRLLNPEMGWGGIFDSVTAGLYSIFIESSMDIPILATLGLLALLFVRKNRLFFTACLLAQWALILILTLRGVEHLRPRRFLLLDMYSIVVILNAFLPYLRETTRRRSSQLILIPVVLSLTVGVVWQFLNLASFCQIDARDRDRCLPYTESRADYFVRPEWVIAADEIARVAKSGKQVLLLYNYNAYRENTTDPTSLLERVYLKLGHDEFKSRVHIFSDKKSRYSQVPINPMRELPPWLDALSLSLQDNQEFAQEYIVVKYTRHRVQRFTDELDRSWTELNARFELTQLQNSLSPKNVENLNPLFEIYVISNREK